MGQKVNPNGLRLGINKDWEAKWYSNKTDFAKYLDRDVKIRKYLEKNLKNLVLLKLKLKEMLRDVKVLFTLQNQVLLLDTVEKALKN